MPLFSAHRIGESIHRFSKFETTNSNGDARDAIGIVKGNFWPFVYRSKVLFNNTEYLFGITSEIV